MIFYELRDDIYYSHRWYLGDIIEVEDNWEFIYGKKIDKSKLPKKLTLRINQDGNPMDYTTTEGYNVPIVSEKIKVQFGGLIGIQFIPVDIEAKRLDLKYYIMVVINKVECVDEERSTFEKFVENDPIRPDLQGHYKWFTKLVINPSKVNELDIFRIQKTGTYLIISDRVKQAMEDVNATGTKLTKVTI